jgi:pimeloyl-ACP methyl ester carboxylesterase
MNYKFLNLIFLLILFLLGNCNPREHHENQDPQNDNDKSITSDDQLTAGKEQRRTELYNLLGHLPDRNRPFSVEVISRTDSGEMVIEKLLMDLNGYEKVPAYFTRPKNPSSKIPVILFNHSHFGQYDVGKNEFLYGRKEMQRPPYALALAREGYAGLCIDSWGFGERHGSSESEIFKEMLWKGQVMWGMMVYDNLRALDYLVSRDDVDPSRIGTMGMSMGSTMSWWLAALDERISVCVDLCCLTDFQTLIEEKGLDLHGIYYYVPDLLNHFSTSDINALIAPRPHFGLTGRFDPLTPLKGLEIIDRNLKEIYATEGASEAWELKVYDVPHFENAEMRKDILAFFEKWL